MVKILGLFPLTGNGGIASWTKKFLDSFPNNEYQIFPINVSPKDSIKRRKPLYRIYSGISALFRIYKEVKSVLRNQHFNILHTTTSGSIGALRDCIIANLCKKKGVKTIMHCRYGCITENYHANNLIGYLTRKSMSIFDQIWVLDKRSYNNLKEIESLRNKVFLTPNSIDVVYPIDETPKKYGKVAFIGNLIPTKGLFELVEACVQIDVTLDIIGPGTTDIVNRVKEIAGDKLDKTIFIHGRLPNQEAVKFMREVDIVALPTYYPSEAFPISILEAMSLSKMVISCSHAAVPDMLTSENGEPCGILVEQKSVTGIINAIKFCQTNSEEADKICQRAYNRVYKNYRKEVVYDIYRKLYDSLS